MHVVLVYWMCNRFLDERGKRFLSIGGGVIDGNENLHFIMYFTANTRRRGKCNIQLELFANI